MRSRRSPSVDVSARFNQSFGLSLAFTGRVQFSTVIRLALASVSLPPGILRMIVDPPPMVAFAPILTGATIMVPEPMKAPSPMRVSHLFAPS